MENNLRAVFAANLKNLLEARGENTVSAAKLSRIDQKTIWNYCHSPSSNPTLTNVETLSQALRVAPYRLLLSASFDNNTATHITTDRIISQLHQLNERQIEHVAELVELLVSEETGAQA